MPLITYITLILFLIIAAALNLGTLYHLPPETQKDQDGNILISGWLIITSITINTGVAISLLAAMTIYR